MMYICSLRQADMEVILIIHIYLSDNMAVGSKSLLSMRCLGEPLGNHAHWPISINSKYTQSYFTPLTKRCEITDTGPSQICMKQAPGQDEASESKVRTLAMETQNRCKTLPGMMM